MVGLFFVGKEGKRFVVALNELPRRKRTGYQSKSAKYLRRKRRGIEPV